MSKGFMLYLKTRVHPLLKYNYTCKKAAVQKEGVSPDAAEVYRRAENRVRTVIENMQTTINANTLEQGNSIQARLHSIMAAMENNLIERSTEVRLLLLATVAGQHIFFIGPPGTGKSELGRRLSRVCSGTYFERLLTKFSVPEELFGPLSMKALEEDQYVRHVKGYLPESRVAFIDEIFKANSAILNSLLTLLNERLFENGNRRYCVPLVCLVGASNEVPETDELDALYDRFLFRKKVKQVSAKGFSDLIYALNSESNEKRSNISPYSSRLAEESIGENRDLSMNIEDNELFSIRTEAQHHVNIPNEVVQLINDTRDFVQTKMEPAIYLSDRRLVNAAKMLKVVAFTNGRTEVSPFDCIILQHCLWQNPEQREPIFEFLVEKISADQEVTNFEVIVERIFARSCLVLTGASEDSTLHKDLGLVQKEIISRLELLTSTLTGSLTVLTSNIWISPEEVSSLSPAVVQKTARSKKILEDLLMESEVLKVILDTQKEPSICAELLGARWADFLKTPLKITGEN